jgi:hypothetical protein
MGIWDKYIHNMIKMGIAGHRTAQGLGPCPNTLYIIALLVVINISLDWFKGKSTGNHGFYHQI